MKMFGFFIPLPLHLLVLHSVAGTEPLHSVLLWRPYGGGSPPSDAYKTKSDLVKQLKYSSHFRFWSI